MKNLLLENSFLIEGKNVLLVSPGLGVFGLISLRLKAKKLFLISENEG